MKSRCIVFESHISLADDLFSINLSTVDKEILVHLPYNELPPKLMAALIEKFDSEMNIQEDLLITIKKLSRAPKTETAT